MKYRFSVTAYAYKEIEVEAENEQEAYDKANDEKWDVEFTEDDYSDYERDLLLLDD